MKTLKIEVMEMLENMVVMNNSTIEEEIINVLEYGCVSGIVNELIYYYQTEAFFNRHKDEINELAHELSEELYGNKYSIYNNMQYECNKNTMAWLGFEETIRIIANELEIEY